MHRLLGIVSVLALGVGCAASGAHVRAEGPVSADKMVAMDSEIVRDY